MNIKAMIRIAIPAMYMAITLSPFMRKQPAKYLKLMNFKKAGTKNPDLSKERRKKGGSSFTAH